MSDKLPKYVVDTFNFAFWRHKENFLEDDDDMASLALYVNFHCQMDCQATAIALEKLVEHVDLTPQKRKEIQKYAKAFWDIDDALINLTLTGERLFVNIHNEENSTDILGNIRSASILAAEDE